MKTPIYEFVKEYNSKSTVRAHMPGHKGASFLGIEPLDITEIDGADSLYHANGIIKESEEAATNLFGSGKTVYSTEGSSHVIRAMMHMAKSYKGNESNGAPYVLATKNAHSAFISSAILSDFDIKWIYPKNEHYLNGKISPLDVENCLTRVDNLPFAVYITSPDYLGNVCDIKGICEVCKRFDLPLIVDNAHGAYLKFLDNDIHPISLGATMTCDSAHKTLPVLTGGAYLHISKDAPSYFFENAKNTLALYGSSSPSYLTLCSLDLANKYINEEFDKKLIDFIGEISLLRSKLEKNGYVLVGDEKIKLTIDTKKYGYYGDEFSKILAQKGIACEFYDKDFIVMMLTPQNDKKSLDVLENALLSIVKKSPISDTSPSILPCKKALSPRDAYFSKKEIIRIEDACGRVCADLNVTCPPCVSIIACGEEFNAEAIELCKYYGIEFCTVTK